MHLNIVEMVSALSTDSEKDGTEFVVKILSVIKEALSAHGVFICREIDAEWVIQATTGDMSSVLVRAFTSQMREETNEGSFVVENTEYFYINKPIHIAESRSAVVLFRKDTPFDIEWSKQREAELSVVSQLAVSHSQIKKLKGQLKKQGDSLDAMETLATIGWWEVDLVNNTIFWSPQTRAIHEVPDDFEPELNTAIEFYKAGNDRDAISHAVTKGIYQGIGWDLEVRLITHTNKEKWVAALGSAEIVNGQCVRLFGAFQDIDVRKRASLEVSERKRELEAMLSARSRFLSRISHELRTPLNAVNGMLSTMNLSLPQQDIQQKLALAKVNTKTLVRLINDISEFNSISETSLTLQTAPFSLNFLLKSVLQHYHMQFSEKGINFGHQFNLDVDNVVGDETRIRQVLTNLLDNAVKFTHSGHVELTMRSYVQDEKVVLLGSVEDTGVGISGSDLPALFTPFVQSTSIANLISQGKGLGLSVVRELCEKMNGYCNVKSEFGKGSKFYFELALLKCDDNGVENDPITPLTREDLSELSILIVDDVDTNRLVAEIFLSELGVDADHAVNGREAVLATEKRHYNLVLMDCHMPLMDGFEASKTIKENFGDRVTIIGMTADTTEQNEARCYEVGMDLVIKKPISLKSITEALNVATSPVKNA